MLHVSFLFLLVESLLHHQEWLLQLIPTFFFLLNILNLLLHIIINLLYLISSNFLLSLQYSFFISLEIKRESCWTLLTSISPTLALSKSGYGSKSILTLSKKLPVSFIIIFLIKIVYFYSYYLCFCSNYKRRCFHEIMYYSR